MPALRRQDRAQAALMSAIDKLTSRAGAWRSVLFSLLGVLAVHLWFLHGVSGLLPVMPQHSESAQSDGVFSTRSIRITRAETVNRLHRPIEPAAYRVPLAVRPATPVAAKSALAVDLPQANVMRLGVDVAPEDAPQAPGPRALPARGASDPAPGDGASLSVAAASPQQFPTYAALAAASAPLMLAAAASTSVAAETPAAPAPAGSPKTPPPSYDFVFPPSVRLKYDVAGIYKGFKYMVAGDLSWLHDNSNYTARLEISHFLLGSKVQTSKGAITPRGLEPLRFGEKVRSEVAAHFEREKGKVSFSANTPDVPLLPLAQDQVSIFVQLAAMFAADGKAFAPGAKLVFQTVGARGTEDWEFVVAPPERLQLQGKEWLAYKLVREHRADYDTRAELWLAPALDGMPLRIRLMQTSGDEIDMTWIRSQKP